MAMPEMTVPLDWLLREYEYSDERIKTPMTGYRAGDTIFRIFKLFIVVLSPAYF